MYGNTLPTDDYKEIWEETFAAFAKRAEFPVDIKNNGDIARDILERSANLIMTNGYDVEEMLNLVEQLESDDNEASILATYINSPKGEDLLAKTNAGVYICGHVLQDAINAKKINDTFNIKMHVNQAYDDHPIAQDANKLTHNGLDF
ncbi:MAG: hypothetical protein ACRBDI_05955 [Alphaproteobacteria bacterium]